MRWVRLFAAVRVASYCRCSCRSNALFYVVLCVTPLRVRIWATFCPKCASHSGVGAPGPWSVKPLFLRIWAQGALSPKNNSFTTVLPKLFWRASKKDCFLIVLALLETRSGKKAHNAYTYACFVLHQKCASHCSLRVDVGPPWRKFSCFRLLFACLG